jgi:hypothetical protein
MAVSGHSPCASIKMNGSPSMGLQLQSAEFLHEDGITYCIRRETLEQDFTIYEKRNNQWLDCGIDQAVKDLNFAEFKRLGLLSKKIMDADQWLA